MHLTHIPLDKLSVAAINMRQSKKAPDLADILPAVRARGILVPLLVRPNGSSDSFEIVAGRRRYYAAKAVAENNGQAFDVPCAIIEAGDDAAALEASLIENVAREAPHEVELWESFAGLVRQGRSAEEIGLTFGLNARQVGQVLALGGLLPKIRDLYRREQIDAASIRLLTMASKTQQKAWLALALDPKSHAPSGQRLKAWLFGGASIPASHAIFDLETYTGEIVTDLFGEERYFASADAFWEAQHAAIAVKRETYLEAGWSDVVMVEPGSYFHGWEHEKTPRKKGGKVFITLSPRGEVAFHEGYLTRAEARRRASGDGDGSETRPARPELTGPLQNYGDLHRHAAVRTALLGAPSVALRLMVAHTISGSHLFAVRADPRRLASDAIAESSELSPCEARFDAQRRKALDLLGLDPECLTLVQGPGQSPGGSGTSALFLKLLDRSDEEVLNLVAIAMGEALEAGSATVEAVGHHLGVDMSKAWRPDAAFFDLLRDRELLLGLVGELAGTEAAAANAKEKTKGLKAIVRNCLSGENGREKVHGWVPRFMRFPPGSYTARGGVGTVDRFAAIKPLLAARSGDPPRPAQLQMTHRRRTHATRRLQ